MIKTFLHSYEELLINDINNMTDRDLEINNFIQEHGCWALTTNVIKDVDNNDILVSTLFYGQKF